MTRNEILECYRRYRQACTAIQTAALKNVSNTSLLATAKRLALADGKRIIANSEDDLVLAFDLALYAAKPGRSRAIDRYARSRQDASGEEAAVLKALADTCFSLFRVAGPHATAGLVLEDLMRGGEVWLVDESLEATAVTGTVFAMRLARPDRFAISCGVVVPVDGETLDELLNVLTDEADDDLGALADDPRFAESIYQSALETGLTEYVSYR